MLTSALPFAVAVLVATASAPDTGAARRPAFDAEDVLGKTRAVYAALTSYADSGTVLDEATGFTDRSTFRTLFTRDPRQLLIEYRAVESVNKNGYRLPLSNHLVLWMENGDLQTWSSKSQAHETYPADGGQQVNALKNAGYFTAGISVLIPSHLYTKSGLPSQVHATEEAEADGFETVSGRRCFRIIGVERWRYPSGKETGCRRPHRGWPPKPRPRQVALFSKVSASQKHVSQELEVGGFDKAKQAVAGVGDSAAIYFSAREGFLVVYAGTRTMTIGVKVDEGQPLESARPFAVGLAKIALAKLN